MRTHASVNKEMTMRTLMRTLCAALALLVLTAWPAQAQRLLTTTTLNAAMTATDDVMTVTSTTGFVVNQLVLVDFEIVRIQSLLNGAAGTATLVGVARGVDGTNARAHANSKRILITQQVNDFKHNDPDWSAACTRGTGQAAILPWVNSSTGWIWNCTAGGTVWAATVAPTVTYGSIPTSF